MFCDEPIINVYEGRKATFGQMIESVFKGA